MLTRRLTGGALAGLTTIMTSSVPAMLLEDGPWGHWGRTANRSANTETIGPLSPMLIWSLEITDQNSDFEASPIMDDKARIFVGTALGVTAIDMIARSVLWVADQGFITRGAAVSARRVVWADFEPVNTLYCYDSETGAEIWTFVTNGAFIAAPVIYEGVVYIVNAGERKVFARSLEDGTEVWTTPLAGASFSSPSLFGDSILLASQNTEFVTHDPRDGSKRWSYGTAQEVFGTAPITASSVYGGSTDGNLYCLNIETGEEVWRFWAEQSIRGSVALGHSGGVYTGTTTGKFGMLFAISPNGEEVWQRTLDGFLFNAPIVDGHETIYAATLTSSPRRGWVEAVNSDGTELWTTEMPDRCFASPMLAPDGTLFIICKDRSLYAFRDPHLRASITNLEVTTGTILDGGINDIAEPDGSYLHTRSGFGRQLSELHKTELIINATVDDPQPAIMRIQIESRTDQPAAMAIVQLRNWTTGNFETVRNYEVESDEQFEWIQIPKGGNGEQVNPQRYIRPSGGIEMKLKHLIFVPFLAFTFESFIDQIKIEVTG